MEHLKFYWNVPKDNSITMNETLEQSLMDMNESYRLDFTLLFYLFISCTKKQYKAN